MEDTGKPAATAAKNAKVKEPIDTLDSAGFSLPNESIRIEFIKRQKGNITNEKHVLFGGMSETAKRRLVPKRSLVNFKYIQILTPEEQAFLEDLLTLEKNGLSVYQLHGNFWDSIYVDLTKNGITLDLSNPFEYIKYKIALSYDDIVCPSIAVQKTEFKMTYQFVIVHKGEKGNEKVSIYNLKKEAYRLASQLEVNPEQIREFLYLSNIRAGGDTSISWLKEKLSEIVENNPQSLINMLAAKDYPTRALLSRGVLSGVIRDINGRFALEDGIQLCEEGEVANLATAIRFLSSPKNSDVRLLIEAKLGK